MNKHNLNALGLLSVYNSDSDSENDIEIIPSMSRKRSCEGGNEQPNKHIKIDNSKKLPLPSVFSAPINDISETDNNGKIRSYPHERGNWSTYVYISYEHNMIIKELISTLISQCENSVLVQPSDDLHISLTKTIILKHHWIDSFMKTITNNISHIGQFITFFDCLKVYCNEERTRTFLGLCIKSGHDTLVNIVEALDRGLNEFNLPTFYENPSFHMSLIWSVGDQEVIYNSFLDKFNEILKYYMTTYPQLYWYIHVKKLLCKTGNKLYKLNLAQNFVNE